MASIFSASAFLTLKSLPIRSHAMPCPLFSYSRSAKVFCMAAKPETVEKVVAIVTEQLATEKGAVQPDSRFGDLGADSLDQVEIVMALEEEFGIQLDEAEAEAIMTVQDAANLIDKVKLGKSKAD